LRGRRRRAERRPQSEVTCDEATVLPASPRLLFSVPKTDTIGIVAGSIMAAIMTIHMMNTARQLAADQSDIGIVSCTAGLPMLIAPQ
jgi:hypothetical protein